MTPALPVWVAAAFGAALRLLLLVAQRGRLIGGDYDEGVYVGGASLLLDGVVPYRDEALLHPPGILLVFAPVVSAAGDLTSSLVAARWLTLVCGIVSILLAGAIGTRAFGPVGVVAAIILAALPAVAATDVHAMQEPYVVVLLLAALWWWTLADDGGRRGVATIVGIGALSGLALLVKFLAAPFLIALLLAGRWRRPVTDRLLFLAGAGTAGLVVMAPFLASVGAGRVFDMVVRTQLGRPPDGTQPRDDRIVQMLVGRSLGPLDGPLAVLGLVLIAVLARRAWRAGPVGRISVVWLGGALTLVLAASSFYEHYAVAVAAPAALVAAGALADLRAARLVRWVTPVGAVATMVVLAAAVVVGVRTPSDSSVPELVDEVPDGDCVYAHNVVVAVGAGLTPASLDPLGASLFAAHEAELDAPDAESLLLSEFVQDQVVRPALDACDWLLVSGELADEAAWTDDTIAYAARAFVLVGTADEAGRTHVALYRRRGT